MYSDIHIIGSGAIGSVIAARLQLARSDLNIANITRHVRGNCVSHVNLLEQDTPVQLNTGLNQWSEKEAQCLIILPMKSYQLIEALRQFHGYFPVNSDLLLLHNGIVIDPFIKKLSERHGIFNATTSHAAYKPSVSECTNTGYGHTVVGNLYGAPSTSKRTAITKVLNRALGPAEYNDDIRVPLWQKVAVNAMINPLTAIHAVKNGELLDAKFEPELDALASEISRVMTADGMAMSPQQVLSMSQSVMRATADNYSSMQQDVLLGRKTEINAINGFILKRAEQHKLPCPTLAHHFQLVEHYKPA